MANTPKIGLKIPSTADNIAEQINIDTPNNLSIIDTEIDGVKTQANDLGAELARSATIVVAASDSKFKQFADYVCDGVSDNSIIIAAKNSLPSSGGKIVLLDGTYYIKGRIDLDKSNMTLQGCGNSTKLLLVNDIGTNEWHSLLNIINGQNIIIRDLLFDGNNQQYLVYALLGVRYESTQESVRVENVTIKNSSNLGIFIKYLKNGAITNIYVDNCVSNGCRVQNSYNVNLTNSIITNTNIGLEIRSNSSNILVNSCQIYDNVTQVNDNGVDTILGTNYIEGAV